MPFADQTTPFEQTMTFEPAGLRTEASRPLESSVQAIRFQVQHVGGEDVLLLSGDPSLVGSLPIFRLVVNAAATFILVILVGLTMAATAPRLLGYGSVVVSSGSMEPAIRVADVVVTSSTDGSDLGEGSVINFVHGDETRLHRIVEATPDGYRTIGDANRTADSDLVLPSQIQGIGIVVVPFVGMAATWVDDGQWLRLGLLLVTLVCLGYVSRSRWAYAGMDPLRP